MPGVDTPQTILSVEGLSKTFGPTKALDRVDFDVRAGEVHGLIGHNGSGKSTMIKILSGFYEPDPGGQIGVGDPAAGPDATPTLAFVHQDLGLVDDLSVLDNLRLRRWDTTRTKRIPWRRERRRAEKLLQEFGVAIDTATLVATLTQVDRALLAIVRALQDIEARESAGNSVLILDEPTAYLPRDDVSRLFRGVERVVDRGAGVVFVSHRLDEVIEHTDRVTVLREGRRVDTVASADATESSLVELMLGRRIDQLYPEKHHPRDSVVLKAEGVSGGLVADVSLTLRAGEIVGVTGLTGMGQDDLPYLIYGSRKLDQGSVEVEGVELSPHSPSASLDRGVALVPANRARDGSVGVVSVGENVTLPRLGEFFRGGILRRGEERAEAADLLESFAVQPPEPSLPFSSLSGGNQQKAILGKWLRVEPSVLLLHEPTQGVDVGSKQQIFSVIRDAAERGCGVLFVSAEAEDLAHLCDRVLVLWEGRISADLQGAELSAHTVSERSYLGRAEGAAAGGGRDE